jgi:hypothetical protein
VRRKQLHILSLATFKSSCQQVNIILFKGGFCTLIVVIIDPTLTNFFDWKWGRVKTLITPSRESRRRFLEEICCTRICCFKNDTCKVKSYCNWYSTNQFLPLVLVFWCSQKKVDVFWHDHGSTNHLGNERARQFPNFHLGHFLLPICFHYSTKDVGIFHLK